MHKITRTLTVIGSAVALTFAGTGVASATSYPAPGGLGDISSRFLNPNYDAERELRDAASAWGWRTSSHKASTLNSRAESAPGTHGAYSTHRGGTVKQWLNTVGNPRYQYFEVNKDQRGNLVTHLNGLGSVAPNHWNYGVHVSTSGNVHRVVVIFAP